ncbi:MULTISPECIES: hypothetical protein [Paenibacillus]|uniref:hypothetical protein n=1 Tax=Paenibacillus TaxID=44249 RepID=UPI0022B902AE|nr:hypothetical protein [Paenibacillus caseinilyticus]MCZ8522003.1 hypothetical protein [Paenibacillus caseinilyticus]
MKYEPSEAATVTSAVGSEQPEISPGTATPEIVPERLPEITPSQPSEIPAKPIPEIRPDPAGPEIKPGAVPPEIPGEQVG